MNGYYIQKQNPTVKIPLEPRDEISLYNDNLIELVLPKCRKVFCHYNYLTELIIPRDCEFVECQENYLIKLTIPIGCKTIYCYDNDLTELIIPHGCTYVNCFNNKLSKLIVPKTCKEVYCFGNNLHPQIEELFQSENLVKIQLANSLLLANNKQVVNNIKI
jgi:hypothetical protein